MKFSALELLQQPIGGCFDCSSLSRSPTFNSIVWIRFRCWDKYMDGLPDNLPFNSIVWILYDMWRAYQRFASVLFQFHCMDSWRIPLLWSMTIGLPSFNSIVWIHNRKHTTIPNQKHKSTFQFHCMDSWCLRSYATPMYCGFQFHCMDSNMVVDTLIFYPLAFYFQFHCMDST